MSVPTLSSGPDTQRSLGLDVLRAAAILLVMLAHWANNFGAWMRATPDPRIYFAGSLGVELFFALSGFLIGRILIEQGRANPTLANLRVFLVRRWMRTLPLYFLVMAVLLVFVPPPELPLRYALKYATMTQNFWAPLPPGWWFAVSWSLAIEEWFYLLFGCAAFAYFRVFRADWAIWPPVAFFVLVPLLLRLALPAYPGAMTLVPFRLDEIAYGVGMAQLHHQRSSLFRHPLKCLAVGVVILTTVWLRLGPGLRFLHPALLYNLTIVGCVLLLPAALALRSLPRLAARIVTSISAQSYGLYLIHLTILERVAQRLFADQVLPLWGAVVLAVTAPFAVSWLTLRLIERPILRLRPKHSGPPANIEQLNVRPATPDAEVRRVA